MPPAPVIFSVCFQYLSPEKFRAPIAAPTVEFHVSRAARDKYRFDDWLFTSTGNVVFANFHAARVFAQKINDKRDLSTAGVKASEINAMGIIDEMLHNVIGLYRQQINPTVFHDALSEMETAFGRAAVDAALLRFVEQFPPLSVYQGKIDVKAYLLGSTDGVAHRMIVLEEMLLLWLANLNPAFSRFRELFDDDLLRKGTVYLQLMDRLETFFEKEPHFGPGGVSLINLLRAPARESPDSLEGQLNFIRSRWGLLLKAYFIRLLGSLDFIREEFKPTFFGPPPTEVPTFAPAEVEHDFEAEQFSQDLHWMPRLVLIAKSTLVWLDQLSEEYQRSIHRLDQIPDEELARLAGWGFTGLWLIGIWERSPASKRIKQLCGNPEAESSAYSLFDYEVAHELGGYDALQNLRERCWHRGIRLACDMVPNHTGIDSRWMREHPDWFVSLPFSPYPSYSFNGVNLSADPRYGVFIEDHYYDRTDAAVVFKRQDYWTGDVRYIYHGNDGTSMPWNDTAQLNYLQPEVREAVIRKIIDVARMFPVIRFDAAMTLAKKHYQRLWFPEPGKGGDIPSRSEFGITRQELNKAMPSEFWREVVDRVAEAVPDTLLLAEAFWLMEGYFVRTLGMHRVYNSAFMNMLKNEENQKYRDTIRNTIQFEPEILKRYVNFMNNPDEDTAVAQFGKGDKYFGICMMMVTMPGLPMFGHGQIEGFEEKYGMEYRRAYHDEVVDDYLVHRHEREIFPVMKRRYLFAEVEHFLLYDFFTSDGHVNENVFVYSNRAGNERALVVYHNRYEHASGWIRTSVPFARKHSGDQVNLVQLTLGQGLDFRDSETHFYIFRDGISGLQYLRTGRELFWEGLYVELNAYQCCLFVDFREVEADIRGHYAELNRFLRGRGVQSIETELRELAYKPFLRQVDELFAADVFDGFYSARIRKEKKRLDSTVLNQLKEKYQHVLQAVAEFKGQARFKPARMVTDFGKKAESLLRIHSINRRFPLPRSGKYQSAVAYLKAGPLDEPKTWAASFAWLALGELGAIVAPDDSIQKSRSLIDEWLFNRRIRRLLEHASGAALDPEAELLVSIAVQQQLWFGQKKSRAREYEILLNLLATKDVSRFLSVNRFDNVLWFNKERFEQLVWWLFFIAVVRISSRIKIEKERVAKDIADIYGITEKWLKAQEESEYKIDKLLKTLEPGTPSRKKGGPAKSARTKKKPKAKKEV